jgi:hypothetical protein
MQLTAFRRRVWRDAIPINDVYNYTILHHCVIHIDAPLYAIKYGNDNTASGTSGCCSRVSPTTAATRLRACCGSTANSASTARAASSNAYPTSTTSSATRTTAATATT